ncbi:FKBP-type peptidyl-prolyl cis-trans isomerase [Parabacteroides sp. OttesenSCG-928-G07]|nr:FKBP-type peptidyl-prolyl cis-trans isomerase [Parabacteroides sp. OttesenSCG-928-G07]
MRKIWFYVMMMCCALVAFSSCNEDKEEPIDEEWKLANETVFNEIAKKAEKGEDGYKRIISPGGNNGFVCYKVLKEGDGTEPIYFNSAVKHYYSGKYILSAQETDQYHYFDNQYDAPPNPPTTFYVNSNVDGWTIALPEMKVGDRWEVWVPQQLGYGSSGYRVSTSSPYIIPPYTTLIFEIEVVEIMEP